MLFFSYIVKPFHVFFFHTFSPFPSFLVILGPRVSRTSLVTKPAIDSMWYIQRNPALRSPLPTLIPPLRYYERIDIPFISLFHNFVNPNTHPTSCRTKPQCLGLHCTFFLVCHHGHRDYIDWLNPSALPLSSPVKFHDNNLEQELKTT